MRELGYTNVIKPYLESKREKDKLTSLATLAGTTLHNSPNPHNLFLPLLYKQNYLCE